MKIRLVLLFTIFVLYPDIKSGLVGKNCCGFQRILPTKGSSAVRQNDKTPDGIFSGSGKVMSARLLRISGSGYGAPLFWGVCLLLIGVTVFGVGRQLKINRLSEKLAKIRKEMEDCTRNLKQVGNEKDWLVREIHHRVKNNLQVVMSLLNLQAGYLTDPKAIQAIKNSHNRMYAVALVHKKLYQAESLSSINMESYIEELMHYLHDEYHTTQPVNVILETVPIFIDIATAVPLALIINEAVSNTLQYAFPMHKAGEIRLTMKTDEDGFYFVRIADNGIGMPPDSESISGQFLGTTLITGLSRQMRAKLKIENAGGVIISLRFKNDRSEAYPLTA